MLQLCPLDLRFSQKKMRNVFADGRLIEDAADLVRAVSRPADEAEIYDAPWRLEAPFPPIEVLRWRCKLRDETTGRPLLDEFGKEVFEPFESWFTLDNRRLYCLQKAATKLWPERCTVDVIAEIRKDRRMREIRKFRTLDSGQSIMVGSRVDGVPFKRWAWREVAAAGSRGRGRGGRGSGRIPGRGANGEGHRSNGYGRGDKGGGREAHADGKGRGKGGRGEGAADSEAGGKGGRGGGRKGKGSGYKGKAQEGAAGGGKGYGGKAKGVEDSSAGPGPKGAGPDGASACYGRGKGGRGGRGKGGDRRPPTQDRGAAS